MAEPSTRFTEDTWDFIRRTQDVAKKYANRIDVPDIALAGAVANEYDTRFNPALFFDTRGRPVQAFGDWLASGRTHEELTAAYNALKGGPEVNSGLIQELIKKAFGPELSQRSLTPFPLILAQAISALRQQSIRYATT